MTKAKENILLDPAVWNLVIKATSTLAEQCALIADRCGSTAAAKEIRETYSLEEIIKSLAGALYRSQEIVQ